MTRFLLRRDPNLNASPSSIEEPGSKRLTPLRELGASVVKSSPVKVPKPRSKIARLPRDIQHNLNTMLAAGCPYMDIIRNLNAQGYPGFNKVNLHDWRNTGFQNWVHTENTKASLGDQAKGDSNQYQLN